MNRNDKRMKNFWRFLAVVVITTGNRAETSAAPPTVVGLSGNHKLSESHVGELLMGELRCAACHTRTGASSPLERTAPDLTDVGARVAPDYLKRYLASPSAVQPGTAMPDLLGAENEEQRLKIAEALTHFLVSQSPRPFRRDAIEIKDYPKGKDLFHSIGCVACHSPRDDQGRETMTEGSVALAHVAAKYGVMSLAEFLTQPHKVRPSGRMPDMKLTPDEARSVAHYLLAPSVSTSGPLVLKDDLVALGRKSFEQLNCAACHKLPGIQASVPVGDLRNANPARGCLSETTGKSPHFHLSPDQTRAVRAALAKPAQPLTDKETLSLTMTAFNCLACHTRDEAGGISEERNPLFLTTAKNLGDESRIPPPLTKVGAKLQPVWLKKVLFDGEVARPYMLTRMPQYGEPNLRHVPGLFSKLDPVLPATYSLPNGESGNAKERARAKEMRDAGRELVGDKNLNCVACHTFNGKVGGNVGVELLTTVDRIQPGWFDQFMRDPSQFRRRTVMPTSWPGGVASQRNILNGDSDRQIEAIWYYLSLGTSAPTPAGLQPVETKLTVTDKARTYRGRSNVAGFRGIAVGFPEKLSYAFNAETGTLTAIWRGEFIQVNRSGQGSGNFNPVGKIVPLAQDVSFFRLADEKTPWPLRPVMTKEQPVNPDPLYPKNRGYQFQGYDTDDEAIPTFHYRSGELEIDDRSAVGTGADAGRLVRTLTIRAPKAETVWFRALTGKIESETSQRYVTPEMRLTIPAGHTALRANSDEKNGKELLLKMDVPPGLSQRTFTYELLK